MALKLGKCRLCLKLGDFYSIFTMDNNLQLAEMVMECARIKIFEGDGLPDKICSECIQKLSSAHIFKQQCERSDQELRRNYIPPPGFSTPTPPNRQSSDSIFSSQTETSKPSTTTETKVTPTNRTRKRSRDSIDNASSSGRSHDYQPGSSKRVDELRFSQKKPRYSANSDSEYEDAGRDCGSPYSGGTDSDEPLNFKCKQCPKAFKSQLSLTAHMKCHKKKNIQTPVQPVPVKEIKDAADDDNKLNCEKCGKEFKLKIMLKRHSEFCSKSPRKELLVSLEPLDVIQTAVKIDCPMCTIKFKTIENLEKHMRICHAAVLKREEPIETTENGKISVPCFYCGEVFEDYYTHIAHFNACAQKTDAVIFECTVCKKILAKKASYFLHLKAHYFPVTPTKKTPDITKSNGFPCRICNKILPSQKSLIKHLSAHGWLSNLDDADDGGDEDESRASTMDETASVHSEYSCSVSSGPLKCKFCQKSFKYKKSLETHEMKHVQENLKNENPDTSTDHLLNETNESYNPDESDSSQEEGEDDNTCDICEKQFSYKRLLLHHKRTKHHMTSGTKRAKINLKDCSVRCLICDIEMKVSAINEHNQTHISVNIRPRNLYTCIECNQQFKSCSGLANHIKLVHRLKQAPIALGADLADFCEVVVTKAEPLDYVQSHNGFEDSAGNGAPLINLSGFTCTICSKQLPTLISLKRHVNWHNNVGKTIEKKLECFVCKEVFRFQCHYKMHMRVHYNDTNIDPKHLICPICNRKSKHLRAAQAHMNFHKQTRFQNKDYECSICKRVFQYRKVYLSHMAIHYKRGESVNNTVVGSVLPNSFDRNVFDGTHTCHHCGKICDSETSLKHHIIWHKSKTSLYGARHQCDICNLQFTNKKRLELHTRAHFEDENGPFKCQICGKGFIAEDYFKRHVKGHNFDHQSHKKRIEKLRKNKVKCPICTRYYPDLVKLIRHLKKTHPESKMIKEDPDAPPPNYYSCKLCAKEFLDERRLQHHEEAHLRKPEFFKCKFCGKKTISLKNHRVHIKGHLTQKYIDDPIKCEHCEETFTRGYDLHYHLKEAHGIDETWIAERGVQTLDGPLKELQCSICYKILASKGNFERHIDYHNTLRCNYCFEYFTGSRFLEGHLAFSCEKKKIIGETEIYPRKIKCYVCYKAFHLQVKLDCHLRTKHDIRVFKEESEGKKELVCDYCFRVFENEYALSTHKIYHRTIGYFGCIYCNRKFNTMTLYRKHKNHHYTQLNVDEPTKCEHCDEKFVAFREMIYHMRDVHGDDKEWVVLPKESIEEECKICHKIFFNLHKHLAYHEENRCKKCGEYFYSRQDYDNHLCAIESDDEVVEAIEGLRPVYEECKFCFKPITRKNSKRLHDQMHRVSGSISCRFCTLKFKTIDAFNIHAFSHRSRKYNKKPIKCRKCGETFVKYGPFIKHMREVHKSFKKIHYRATVLAEKCVVCHEKFPNLHNHYRAHLQNQCLQCLKFFTSFKLFNNHQCDKEDADPSKVFTCDANLSDLIDSYVPKDEKDDEKYYGYEENGQELVNVGVEEEEILKTELMSQDEDSQNSIDIHESEVHEMVHAPIISDVLSLYKTQDEKAGNDNGESDVVVLTDEEGSVGYQETLTVITIED